MASFFRRAELQSPSALGRDHVGALLGRRPVAPRRRGAQRQARWPASPIDLIPDFIPVLGYADDAVIVAITLRSVIRRAGPAAIAKHWPGTPDGLRALQRLTGTSRTPAYDGAQPNRHPGAESS